jgi:hypothetical protein
MRRNDYITTGEQSGGMLTRRQYMKLASAGASAGVSGVGLSGLESRVARAASVVDDFEDGDMGEYSGEVSKYTVQSSTTLEGNYSLEATDVYGKIANSSSKGETTRGNEYVARVLASSGSGGYPGLIVGAQNLNYPGSDCYMTILQPAKDNLLLLRRDSGSNTTLDSVSVSLSEGTEYRLALRYGTDRIQVSVQDSNGNKLAGTDPIEDTIHSGGYFGFYTGGGTPVYYDYAENASLNSTFKDENILEPIDHFGYDLDAYEFDRGSSGANLVHKQKYSGPNRFGGAYAGERALKISEANTEMISTSGLDNYPSAGDTLSGYFMAVDPADKLNITWGVQDHENRYFLHMNYADQEVLLCKNNAGITEVLGSATNVGFSYDTWYWAEIEWYDDGTQDAYIYDVNENMIVEVSGTDSEWTSGGIGYDAYLGSGGTVYFDYFNIGHHSNDRGHWGPVVINGGEVLTSEDTGDDRYDYIYDLIYWISYDGKDWKSNEDVWEYIFSVGARTNTYKRETTFADDPHPSKLDPLNEVGYHRDDLEIKNAGTSDHDYIVHNPEKKTAGYLTSTEWNDEVAKNWDDPVSPGEYRERAIKDHQQEFFDRDFILGSIGTISGTIGFIVGSSIFGAVSSTAGLIVLVNDINELTYECKQNFDPGDTKERHIWDFCADYPLTYHQTEYALKVPDGDHVDVQITQDLNPGTELQAGNQRCVWDIHLPGDESPPSDPDYTLY